MYASNQPTPTTFTGASSEMSDRPQTPLLAVDMLIEYEQKLVVIQRKNPPLGWAFPGGFVDVGETLEQAAVREAKEETNLDIKLRALLGCYSEPNRDPRGHTVSAVYIATGTGQPRAQDDAIDLRLFAAEEIVDLVFDHAKILRDYKGFIATGRTPLNGHD